MIGMFDHTSRVYDLGVKEQPSRGNTSLAIYFLFSQRIPYPLHVVLP